MASLRRISTRKRRKVDQVGFSSLPDQVHRKSLKRGFEFTLLVVGDSGLGKSTLVNSLFMTDLYSDRVLNDAAATKTVSITVRSSELEEKGVRLKLTVVDTPGFGDALDSKNSWKTIADYIDEQLQIYYQHESGYGQERKKLQDTRIHCCLYFIPPYVRGLRPIDVETMKCLQTRVNIVPVIGKADSLTKSELEALKQNILNDIDKFGLKIYEFPICDSDDDDSFKKMDEEIKNAIPFGLIGSNTILESGNKRVRGRVYPWGIIDIESNCCDFSKLRTFLCSSHMQDLKDLTHDVHYENYRTELIRNKKTVDVKPQVSTYISTEEADKLLQQKDQELKKMQELIAKMKFNLNSQTATLPNGIGNGNAHQTSSSQPSSATLLSSFGRNAANPTSQGYSIASASNHNHHHHHHHAASGPTFPASSYSLVNRNISMTPQQNGHEATSIVHRNLATAHTAFINSTPI